MYIVTRDGISFSEIFYLSEDLDKCKSVASKLAAEDYDSYHDWCVCEIPVGKLDYKKDIYGSQNSSLCKEVFSTDKNEEMRKCSDSQ